MGRHRRAEHGKRRAVGDPGALGVLVLPERRHGLGEARRQAMGIGRRDGRPTAAAERVGRREQDEQQDRKEDPPGETRAGDADSRHRGAIHPTDRPSRSATAYDAIPSQRHPFPHPPQPPSITRNHSSNASGPRRLVREVERATRLVADRWAFRSERGLRRAIDCLGGGIGRGPEPPSELIKEAVANDMSHRRQPVAPGDLLALGVGPAVVADRHLVDAAAAACATLAVISGSKPKRSRLEAMRLSTSARKTL